MSSIYQIRDWWYYQVYVTDQSGKKVRVQRSLRTKDKKEGRRRQKELDEKYLRDQVLLIVRTPLDEKVREYIDHRLERMKQKELTENTLRSDRGSLRILMNYFENEGLKYLNEFEDRDRAREILERFITFRRGQGVSPNTIRRDLRHLSGFFTYCVTPPRRYLQFNPVSEVTLPRPSQTTVFPDQKDWEILRSHLRTQSSSNPSLNESVLWFQIETGMRIGEVLRLKWERESSDLVGIGEPWSVVEDKCGEIRLYSKRRERRIPLSGLFNGKLTQFLKTRQVKSTSKYVFPSPVTDRPLNVSQFSRSFRKLILSLGITKVFGTHGIRHGYISYLLNQGVSSDQIMWLVGHSSSEITRIYSHPDIETLGKIISRLG